ncbi:MAG TPA: hypothetical protein VI757_08515 [Bacteroidia bacterium]|nr:hypothetical protein [Bacteroidia bacterium]
MSKKRDFIPGDQVTRKTNGKVFSDELVIDGTNFGTFDTEFGKSAVANAAVQAQTQTTNAATYPAPDLTLAANKPEGSAQKPEPILLQTISF